MITRSAPVYLFRSIDAGSGRAARPVTALDPAEFIRDVTDAVSPWVVQAVLVIVIVGALIKAVSLLNRLSDQVYAEVEEMAARAQEIQRRRHRRLSHSRLRPRAAGQPRRKRPARVDLSKRAARSQQR